MQRLRVKHVWLGGVRGARHFGNEQNPRQEPLELRGRGPFGVHVHAGLDLPRDADLAHVLLAEQAVVVLDQRAADPALPQAPHSVLLAPVVQDLGHEVNPAKVRERLHEVAGVGNKRRTALELVALVLLEENSAGGDGDPAAKKGGLSAFTSRREHLAPEPFVKRAHLGLDS